MELELRGLDVLVPRGALMVLLDLFLLGLLWLVAAMSDGVARGSFPAVPGDFDEYYSEFENCRLCDFTRICSRARGVDFARKAGETLR